MLKGGRYTAAKLNFESSRRQIWLITATVKIWRDHSVLTKGIHKRIFT